MFNSRKNKMTKSELIDSIYNSFKDIQLEEGVGLYEADCIDDYIPKDDPVYIGWKLRDEREDWKKILPLFLTNEIHERAHSGNFFFMDAKGKRFHLPCYLLKDLDNRFSGENPLITVLTFEPENLSDFNILNETQKQTILDFLDFKTEEFLNENNDFDFDQYNKAKAAFVKHMKQ